jgi:hypothetical protein
VLVAFVAIFGGLAGVIMVSDDFGGARIAGIPWTWITLGPPSYATIYALGVIYRRVAERNEADFADLIERRTP